MSPVGLQPDPMHSDRSPGDLVVVDTQRLATLRALTADAGPGDAVFTGLVQLFRTTSAAYLADLRAAFSAGDQTHVSLTAHTLKGAAAQMGAVRLAAVAQRVDNAARAGACAAEDMADLAAAVADIHAALAAWCDPPAAPSVAGARELPVQH